MECCIFLFFFFFKRFGCTITYIISGKAPLGIVEMLILPHWLPVVLQKKKIHWEPKKPFSFKLHHYQTPVNGLAVTSEVCS